MGVSWHPAREPILQSVLFLSFKKGCFSLLPFVFLKIQTISEYFEIYMHISCCISIYVQVSDVILSFSYISGVMCTPSDKNLWNRHWPEGTIVPICDSMSKRIVFSLFFTTLVVLVVFRAQHCKVDSTVVHYLHTYFWSWTNTCLPVHW